MTGPDPSDPNCEIWEVLSVFKGRWKGEIIAQLHDRTRRYSELRKLIPKASARVMTASLRDLERDGVVLRKRLEGTPARVDYSLSAYGEQLVPLLDAIRQWGKQHFNCVQHCRKQYDREHAKS